MTDLSVVEQYVQEFASRDVVYDGQYAQLLESLTKACGGNQREAMPHYNRALLARAQRLAGSGAEEATVTDEAEADLQPPPGEVDQNPTVEPPGEVDQIPTEVPLPTDEDARKPLAAPPTRPNNQDVVVQELLNQAWESRNPDVDHPIFLGRLPNLLRERYPTLTEQAAFSLSSSLIRQYAVEQLKDKEGGGKKLANISAGSFNRIAREQAAKGRNGAAGNTVSTIGIGYAAAIFIALWAFFSVVLHAVYHKQTVQVAMGSTGEAQLQVISSQNPWIDALSQGAVAALSITVLMVLIPLFFVWLYTLIRKEESK